MNPGLDASVSSIPMSLPTTQPFSGRNPRGRNFHHSMKSSFHSESPSPPTSPASAPPSSSTTVACGGSRPVRIFCIFPTTRTHANAVLNHAPVSVIGSRQIKHFELPLVRFDVPPSPASPRPLKPFFQHQTSKPKAPRIRYSVHVPAWPIGPLDIVSIPVSLLPLDHDCIIRSASLVVERHIQLNDFATPVSSSHSPYPIPPRSSSSPTCSPSSSPSHSRSNAFPPSFQEPSPPTFNAAASVASDISSDPTVTPHSIYPSTSSFTSDMRPLLPSGDSSVPMFNSPSMPSKVIVNSVVAVDSSPQFSRDSQGVWVKTITFQWPAAKSHSRWTIGETIQSDLVSVKFFVRVKVSLPCQQPTCGVVRLNWPFPFRHFRYPSAPRMALNRSNSLRRSFSSFRRTKPNGGSPSLNTMTYCLLTIPQELDDPNPSLLGVFGEIAIRTFRRHRLPSKDPPSLALTREVRTSLRQSKATPIPK